MTRNKNVVSDDRKASMKRYNANMSSEQKQQNAMTKLFCRLQSGETKSIQKNTLTKYPWTEAEKTFLKNFIVNRGGDARRRIIDTAPKRGSMDDIDTDSDHEEPPQEPAFDYKKELHCDKVREYMGTRTNYKPNRIGASPKISDATLNMDVSNVNVLCRVYKTEDFRKIFDDTPEEFNRKVSEHIIPKGSKGAGGTYSSATKKKKMAVLFTLMNEYPPAVSYLKNETSHDFETYHKKLGELSGELKFQEQAQTNQRIETKKTTQTEILDNVKALFWLEETLKQKSLSSKSGNLHYLIILLYTYGMFNKTIKPENVAFISRLSLNKIKLVSNPKQVFEGNGKFFNTATGRMYLKGRDTSKTAFTYDYIVPKYVKDQIIKSIEKYPRAFLLGSYTAPTVGRIFKELMNKYSTASLVSVNTDYRHLMETVFRLLDVDEVTLSKAMGHEPRTGKAIYKLNVTDEDDDGKRQLIVDYFKSLV
jgi:hypothetical protein